jgi:hypothetical protein
MNVDWKGIAGQFTAALSPQECVALANQVADAPPPSSAEVAAVLSAYAVRLAGKLDPTPAVRQAWEHVRAGLTSQLALAAQRHAGDPALDQAVRDVAAVYRSLGSSSPDRYELLELLAAAGTRSSLTTFADLVAEDPPTAHEAGLAFAPLFRHAAQAQHLFPRLLDAVANEATAALVLDLANHLVRSRVTTTHPAKSRAPALAALFGELAGRMQRLEQEPAKFAATPAELAQTVARSVALAAALADALGLCGDVSVVGKLRQAFHVGHRRIQAEASAALGRLGEDEGIETLVRLAGDPGIRTRALAYLEELGKLDQAAAEHRSPEARAEGDLAAWLAQPTRFGLPPTSLELVDTRRQFWPGYDEPQECFLLRFEYQLPRGVLRGIGMAGPITHVLSVDLEDLPPGDIYAAYCGWYAEHDEISETPAAELPPSELAAYDPLIESLALAGYADARLAFVGSFFGREFLVFDARRDGRAGVLVSEGDEREWFPQGATPRPIGAREGMFIHLGRKILATFNTQEP